MLLTTLMERDIGRLLQNANAHEANATDRVDIDTALQFRKQGLLDGYAVSRGTSVPGAAALAVLLPTPKGSEPLTLSLGGPILEIEQELTVLLDVLREAVSPFREAIKFQRS
jgi:DNA-binding IclR family transcriptional regulator